MWQFQKVIIIIKAIASPQIGVKTFDPTIIPFQFMCCVNFRVVNIILKKVLTKWTKYSNTN